MESITQYEVIYKDHDGRIGIINFLSVKDESVILNSIPQQYTFVREIKGISKIGKIEIL